MSYLKGLDFFEQTSHVIVIGLVLSLQTVIENLVNVRASKILQEADLDTMLVQTASRTANLS